MKTNKKIINPYLSNDEFYNKIQLEDFLEDYFRIDSLRNMGKICFLTLNKDLVYLQALLKSEVSNFIFKKGNIVFVSGLVKLNHKGTKILEVQKISLIEKGLEIVDSNYYKLSNTAEIRKNSIYRLYEMKKTIVEKTILHTQLRNFLISKNYLETTCPIISTEYGGANAKSFTTTRRDKSYYLSICPELYLKRYLIVGFSKVFSIHRSFRNESFDNTHYPEFDMIELYETSSTAEQMKDLFFQFLVFVSSRFVIDLNYKTRDFFTNPLFTMSDYEKEISNNKGWLVVKGLPHSESPLCKERTPGISDQIEIYYDSLEIVNIYTEETNCEKLSESFKNSTADSSSKAAFLRDFSHEISPTGGMGFGLDRLLMILLKKSKIEEVLPFIVPTF